LPQAAVKPAPEKQAAEPTAAQLQNAVDHINEAMRQSNSNVEFTIDKDTKQTIIKVIESSTGDVIRQYPSEEVLAIARAIDRMQQQQGLLIKQEA
jgi:flagellar protein FlaG